MNCAECKFWSEPDSDGYGTCEAVGFDDESRNKPMALMKVNADDDQGLYALFRTNGCFFCRMFTRSESV